MNGPYDATVVTNVGSVSNYQSVVALETRKEANDRRCTYELRCFLPPVVYGYIRGCKSAMEIWDRPKENSQGTEKTNKSSHTQFLFRACWIQTAREWINWSTFWYVQ